MFTLDYKSYMLSLDTGLTVANRSENYLNSLKVAYWLLWFKAVCPSEGNTGFLWP